MVLKGYFSLQHAGCASIPQRTLLNAQLEGIRSAPRHGGGVQLLIDHQVNYLDSELRWLDGTIATLGEVAAGSQRKEKR